MRRRLRLSGLLIWLGVIALFAPRRVAELIVDVAVQADAAAWLERREEQMRAWGVGASEVGDE